MVMRLRLAPSWRSDGRHAIGGGLDAAVQGALEIGPTHRALEGQLAELRDAAINSLREALAPLARGDTVVLPGSIWIVTARAG